MNKNIRVRTSINHLGFGNFNPEDSLVQQVTFWTKDVFNQVGEIFFYPRDCDSIANIRKDGDYEFVVTKNPHLNLIYLKEYSPELKTTISEHFNKHPEEKCALFDLKEECLVTDDHFIASSAPDTPYIMFRTSPLNKYKSPELRPVYILDLSYRNDDSRELMDLFARSSRVVIPPINHRNCSSESKEFTYMLLKSFKKGWEKVETPVASKWNTLDFPVAEPALVYPSVYDSEEFIAFCDTMRENFHSPFSQESSVEMHVSSNIYTTFLNKGTVLLTDLLEFGVEKTINFLPLTSGETVGIDLNIPGILKKGCITHEKVYGVLLPDVDWESFTGESSTSFEQLSDEEYEKQFGNL